MAKRASSQIAAAEMTSSSPSSPGDSTVASGSQSRVVVWNTTPQPHKLEPQETYAEPCGWMESRARWTLLKKGSDLLIDVATLRGTPRISVAKVRACVVKGVKAAYVIPADDNDPQGIEVRTDGGASHMNLYSVLGPAGLLVPKGYKDRYVVSVVGDQDGSPCGWALMIDLAKYEERKEVKVRSSKRGSSK